jgi:hypothetical protein
MAPKSYKSRFIEPGLTSYEDSDQGTVLVSKEALDRMAPSFKGCPVIFVPEQHSDVNKENAFNFEDIGSNPPDGIITGVPYWGDDGWQWVDYIVWGEDAQRALDREYEVSCSYDYDDYKPGDQWHQIPYDYEITEGHYNHLAIVPRGRYEGTRTLANSKGGHNMALFGIKPKTKENAIPPVAPEKKPEEEMVNAEDATVDVSGTPVPLYELIEAYKMKMGAGNTPTNLTPEDEVEVEGFGRVKVADLIAAYGPGSEAAEEPMENAEPPTDTAAEDPVDPSKQMKNAAPVKPKVNASLRNAALNPDGDHPGRGIETESQRLERGHSRYTIPVKNGGTK